MWILTSEHNAYDQFGEYFEAAWIKKPTRQQLKVFLTGYTEEGIDFILLGGGRKAYEDYWMILREVEEGEAL